MVRKQKKKMHYIQLDNGGIHVDHTDDLQTYRPCVRCVDTPVQRRVVVARVAGSKKLFVVVVVVVAAVLFFWRI